MRSSYEVARSNAHRVGGTTMAEAVALRPTIKGSTNSLFSILSMIDDEARACTTEAAYAEVRAQQVRIREVLIRRGAL